MLTDLPTAWAGTREKRKQDSKYTGEVKAILGRFVAFMQKEYPKTKELLLVRPEMTKAFLAAEEARGVSPTTWNYALKHLRSTFHHLAPQSPAYRDHLQRAQSKEKATVHHEPFTVEDLQAIIQAAQDDDFIRPIITTGICTAMRRADCCQLRWENVNLEKGIVLVKTEKTGAMIGVPIFPLLHQELLKCQKRDSGFVFPKQAEMMATNSTGITLRVRHVLKQAGFKDPEEETETVEAASQPPAEPMLATSSKATLEHDRGELRQTREVGLRRASIRGFHSFRTTWITLALTNGVPMEVVRKVTGHATVEVVLQHYFRPDPEQFRAVIQRAMPDLLLGGNKSESGEMLEILRSMTEATWKQDRDRLVKMLS